MFLTKHLVHHEGGTITESTFLLIFSLFLCGGSGGKRAGTETSFGFNLPETITGPFKSN